MISPKTLKGFRDFLPKEESKRQWCLDNLTRVFTYYGLSPMDTPALEYSEILLGKGGGETDKQVYQFKDKGDRQVSLRFDLTVPLARYVSQHWNQLTFPFKRYHMAKVWRGENPQKGRYREFLQCDFDILGANTLLSDVEVLLLSIDSLLSLGLSRFKIAISHRSLVKELLKELNLQDKEISIVRILDKVSKIGKEAVKKSLREEEISCESIDCLMLFIESGCDTSSEALKNLAYQWPFLSSWDYLFKVVNIIQSVDKNDYIKIDLSITRGLDYYTGLIFETSLEDFPSLGSICSGGRYDDLLRLYSKNSISGVGGSIGLDRLLNALENGDKEGFRQTQAVILFLNEQDTSLYFRLAHLLRKRNIRSEVYLNYKKLSYQFKFAEEKGAKLVIFSGSEGFSFKDIFTGEIYRYQNIKIEEFIEKIVSFLN